MTFINPWDERFIYKIQFTLPSQPERLFTRTIIEKDLFDEETITKRWLRVFPETRVENVYFTNEAMEMNERKYKALINKK
ncbi:MULTISPECIES: hypothetical protein [Listeria]|uniref:hypothetical protein n=1 Tax=Listeria TaxID=1637 RepID=UPI000B58B473|nr:MULTISPECIES: hypothetical protein [Listeria]